MKPLTNKLIINAAALLAFACARTAAYAQGNPPAPNGSGVDLIISISGTATVQSTNSPISSDNGTTATTKYESQSLKFSTTSILNLISNDFSTTFSSKAVLVYSQGTVEVVDGANTVDVSSDITISLDPNGDGVWTGSDVSNDNTGADAQKFSGTYIFGLSLQDQVGDSANIGGLATESYSQGVDGNGNPTKSSDSLSVSLIGDGRLFGGNVNSVFKLTVKGTATNL